MRTATCALQCWRARPQLSVLRAGVVMVLMALWHEHLLISSNCGKHTCCMLCILCSALVLLTGSRLPPGR